MIQCSRWEPNLPYLKYKFRELDLDRKMNVSQKYGISSRYNLNIYEILNYFQKLRTRQN